MAQPSETFRFALDNVDEEGLPTKGAIPTEMEQTGLRKGTPWARVWHNFTFNIIGDYLSWFSSDVYKVGAVVMFKTGQEPDFANDWEGTWVSNHVDGANGITYWERTA